jgi:coenzyme F420-reducing hydrogenase alpha subunit
MKAGTSTRTIKVDYLARVEGEGGIHVRIKGDKVQDVQLRIFEPPRLFEAFLRGRHFMEVPDLTARICGICPVAYQLTAARALERALGIPVDPAVRMLRRLFYCGEYIESHALHVYMLHAQDFLGYEDVVQMAKDHRPLVENALRLKKIGNTVMALLGGREVHPVSICVGGFYRVPSKSDLLRMKDDLEWALATSIATARLVSTFEFPEFEQDYEFVALQHADEYALCEGEIVSNRGLRIDPGEYDEHFFEQHVPYSNALRSQLRERGSYLVGPLARFNLNFDRLPPPARELARECDLTPPVLNPFRSIAVRAIELIFACAESLRIIAEYEPPPEPRAKTPPRVSTGRAVTEAPRGILYHRYSMDDRGLITDARIIPPTSQNQKRIEDDLWGFVPGILARSDEEITLRCEQAVRNYDPCISCATHALRVRLSRE